MPHQSAVAVQNGLCFAVYDAALGRTKYILKVDSEFGFGRPVS
jgi:hypothetical protein